MHDITITVTDNHGRQIPLQLPVQTNVADVAYAAQQKLGLPARREDDTRLDYALFYGRTGRFLNPELTLYGLQVVDRAALRILPRPRTNLLELELLSLPNPGMIYPMIAREISIGREFSNGIVIRHKAVSRQHGLFEWVDGFHVYMDIGSANGSWINNQAVTQPTPLAPGDLLLLGQRIELRYRERQAVPSYVETGALEMDAPHQMPDESHTGLVDIPRAQVVISHHPNQGDLARAIAVRVRQGGMQPLLESDDPATLVRRADALVAIISRAAVNDAALVAQWRVFWETDKPLLPVLYEPARLPDIIADAPRVIEYNYDDQQLAQAITQTLAKMLI
ncbi:MAG: FHA domain-containing protein [Anaerolineales bacterium]